ncbi:MAG: polyprenyl synthetase family protein [Leptolyngbya sp. PLA1]|nr:polyprenyl synthetase family protein [Leptolyngbya sp. PLA1]
MNAGVAGGSNRDELSPGLFPSGMIEDQLKACITWPGAPRSLVAAAEYALLGGGKRLRPALAWHACVAAGGDGRASLLPGAAIEIVHAFSLVHDDLPAIDNDDMRRGRPTLHRHAGEAMAILAGDALLAGAFDSLLRAPATWAQSATGQGDARLRVALLQDLSQATSAMIQGQVWDTMGGLPEGLSPTERLRLIHSSKTGALLAAACRMGARSAFAGWEVPPATTMAAIGTYGDSIGLMFQAVDDLIDATQTAEHAGKRTGKDAAAGKLTYPGVLGIDGTRSEIARLRVQALEAISSLGTPAEGLRSMLDYLAGRTK